MRGLGRGSFVPLTPNPSPRSGGEGGLLLAARLKGAGGIKLAACPTPFEDFMRIPIVFLLAFPFLPAPAQPDWPQFRGPDGQGHSSATGLPLQWSETTNIRWKVPIPGRGWSSPVLGGGQIWLTTALDDGHSLRALCLEQQTGKLIHNIEVFQIPKPPVINGKNSYASPTPVLEPGRLYVHFGTFGTACIDTSTGKILWTNQELRLDHKEGPGSSPAVCGDLLILNCDGIDVQYVAALDKHSGRVAWKTPRSGAPTHTPISARRTPHRW